MSSSYQDLPASLRKKSCKRLRSHPKQSNTVKSVFFKVFQGPESGP